jgi:hypothetical protein
MMTPLPMYISSPFTGIGMTPEYPEQAGDETREPRS